jgi:hypothetical protein
MILLSQLFDRRIRGVRVIEGIAVLALIAMILWVYMAKADAGRESAEIGEVRSQVLEERRALKQLRAESAHLEQYKRIETLSQALGMAPAKPAHETAPEALPVLARGGTHDGAGDGGRGAK